MSWARFGCEDSDVYLFPTTVDGEDVGECCMCALRLIDGGPFYFRTDDLGVMISHLDQHRAAGGTVPDSVYEEVRSEWAEYMDVAS